MSEDYWLEENEKPRFPKYIPVTKWNDYHVWPTVSGLRNLIFYRKTNGLDLFKVVKKIGKRVLINEKSFFDWIDAQDN